MNLIVLQNKHGTTIKIKKNLLRNISDAFEVLYNKLLQGEGDCPLVISAIKS